VAITGKPADGKPPSRSLLRIFPETMANDFYIESLPANDSFESDESEFFWKLWPKSTTVREIPSLALAYFSPIVNRYLTPRTDPIPIAVTPRPRVVDPSEIPSDLPGTFFDRSERWSAALASIDWISFLECLLISLAAVVISWVIWRRGGHG